MRGHHTRGVVLVASLAAAVSLALPSATSARTTDQGGTVEVRGEEAAFFPTSPDGGVILLPDPRARAVFDHDRSDRETATVATAGAVKLLADEDSVPALVRRLDAPKDEDAYAMTLSQMTFDPDRGFSATAVLDDAPNRMLGGSRVDSGVPPVELGTVELVALDRNVPVGRDGGPRAPTRASSTGYDTVYVRVTSNFPGGTTIDFQASGGDCISNQSNLAWGQNDPPSSEDISFKVVSSGSDCWIAPSVAKWQVSILPPGVYDINKLWVYIEVNQLSPWSWHAGCTTINQPLRPSCTGDLQVNDNLVNITISPGS